MNRTSIVIPMALLMSVSLVAATATAANATPSSAERTEAVRYNDLDLTSPSGVRAFDGRIAEAISRVCNFGDVRDIWSLTEERRCRNRARHAVNAQRGQAVASANQAPIQLSGR